MAYKVAVLVGSLRKGSFNRMIAQTLTEVAPDTLEFEFVEIGDLPLYNPDLDEEGSRPAAWDRFRGQLGPKDAVLFVSPEYNRSMPAAIKNAIDVGSRPYGASSWDGKAALVATGSMGGIGGFGANHAIRQALTFVNVAPMQMPELYVPAIHELYDENGQITKEGTRDFFKSVMDAFADWTRKVRS